MYRKLIFFVGIVLMLALVSVSYADVPEPNIVIGDWEQQMDGWISWGSATLSYSQTGVTLHEWSLQVAHNSGWNIDPVYPMQNVGNVHEFFTHSHFGVDVTRLANEWVPDPGSADQWSNLGLVINCGPTDGSVPPAGWLSLGDYGPGWWSPADGDRTQQFVWDYSAIRDALAPYEAQLAWLELVIYSNTGGYLSPVTYYLDNARLGGVPEPATIALLGLGSLALLRRRKR